MAFAPSPDLMSTLELFLFQRSQELDDIVDERGIYQLVFEMMEMGYAKLVEVLEE